MKCISVFLLSIAAVSAQTFVAGQAGREHVREHCNVDLEAAKLARLLGLTAAV